MGLIRSCRTRLVDGGKAIEGIDDVIHAEPIVAADHTGLQASGFV
ncbi:MAG TPA: hypothetical protein VEF72_29810 [Mycobacterium sp.]|nr:hypothetical protein [Mycobacterium sp.]